MSKFQKYLNLMETSNLPTHFDTGEEFMDFVYGRFDDPDTSVENQGSTHWFAEIVGDRRIKMATYDAETGLVIWQDAEGEEV